MCPSLKQPVGMKQGIAASVEIFRLRTAIALWGPGGHGEQGEGEQEEGGGDHHPHHHHHLVGGQGSVGHHQQQPLLIGCSQLHERLFLAPNFHDKWFITSPPHYCPYRHFLSHLAFSGNICPEIVEHRIPLNLKKFLDSGTAWFGEWGGTVRGQEPVEESLAHTDTPIQPPRLITHPLQTGFCLMVFSFTFFSYHLLLLSLSLLGTAVQPPGLITHPLHGLACCKENCSL